MDYRIVILNYNGEEILRECLPSVVEAASRGKVRGAVTVLDNGSRDGSERYVKDIFPGVDFVKSGFNAVFCSYNDYAKSVKEEILIFLNSDIRVTAGFADGLVEALRLDPGLLFAAPKSFTFSGAAYEGSLSKMEFRWGLLF